MNLDLPLQMRQQRNPQDTRATKGNESAGCEPRSEPGRESGGKPSHCKMGWTKQ
jgi:hypothetical protein